MSNVGWLFRPRFESVSRLFDGVHGLPTAKAAGLPDVIPRPGWKLESRANWVSH